MFFNLANYDGEGKKILSLYRVLYQDEDLQQSSAEDRLTDR